MSKRISEVNKLGRETRALLSEADARASRWSEKDLIEVREIVAAADVLVELAETEWSNLREVAQAAAPGVVGPTHEGVTIIRNRGDDAEARAALWAAWRETTSVTAARRLSNRFDQLASG